jgi:hypothetical protein
MLAPKKQSGAIGVVTGALVLDLAILIPSSRCDRRLNYWPQASALRFHPLFAATSTQRVLVASPHRRAQQHLHHLASLKADAPLAADQSTLAMALAAITAQAPGSPSQSS